MDGTELRKNIAKIHTTELGAERIKRNLAIQTEDVAAYCRALILDPEAQILGHRDLPNVRKDCPCFDAKTEYQNL